MTIWINFVTHENFCDVHKLCIKNRFKWTKKKYHSKHTTHKPIGNYNLMRENT